MEQGEERNHLRNLKMKREELLITLKINIWIYKHLTSGNQREQMISSTIIGLV